MREKSSDSLRSMSSYSLRALCCAGYLCCRVAKLNAKVSLKRVERRRIARHIHSWIDPDAVTDAAAKRHHRKRKLGFGSLSESTSISDDFEKES